MRYYLVIKNINDWSRKEFEKELNKKKKWLIENFEKIDYKNLYFKIIFDREFEYFNIKIEKKELTELRKNEIAFSYEINEIFLNKPNKEIISEITEELKKYR